MASKSENVREQFYAKSVLTPQELTYEEFQVATAIVLNFLLSVVFGYAKGDTGQLKAVTQNIDE